MPHVSKNKIEHTVVDEIESHLAILFARIKNKQDITIVLNDLLTRTERIMIAKRLAIILMLERNYPFRIISKTLKVSEATISAMRDRFDRGGDGFEKILSYFEEHNNFKKLDYLISAIIRLFAMPPYAGKGRWKFFEDSQK